MSRSDKKLVDSALETGVIQSCQSPHGKSAEQTRKAQKGGLDHLALTGAETALKGAGAAAHGAAGVAAGAASVVLTAGVHVFALYKAAAEAAELRDAHQRDAINLAFVWTASAALPRDYVARVGYELRTVGGERGGASKILTPLMKDDALWQGVKSRAESHVRMARRFAEKSGIDSLKRLEQRLARDQGFARLYRGSMAFRHGVDSFVFEREQRRIAQGR